MPKTEDVDRSTASRVLTKLRDAVIDADNQVAYRNAKEEEAARRALETRERRINDLCVGWALRELPSLVEDAVLAGMTTLLISGAEYAEAVQRLNLPSTRLHGDPPDVIRIDIPALRQGGR